MPGPLPASPSYAVPDPDPIVNRGITETELEWLFGVAGEGHDERLRFAHNNSNECKMIVGRSGKIVGIFDWEMAGYFGLERAGKVHARYRTPRKELYVDSDLSEERIADVCYWNDLYVGLGE